MASRTLHIIRHGKSSWDLDNISDIDRPLSDRGINNAYFMAKKLSERKVKPGILLSSPANRALYTAIIFARVMKLPYEKIRIEDSIYMGYTDDILELVGKQDNSVSDILIFGHNPAFTMLANQLMSDQIDNIPTSGIVSLPFAANEWSEIGRMKASEYIFDYPRRYS